MFFFWFLGFIFSIRRYMVCMGGVSSLITFDTARLSGCREERQQLGGHETSSLFALFNQNSKKGKKKAALFQLTSFSSKEKFKGSNESLTVLLTFSPRFSPGNLHSPSFLGFTQRIIPCPRLLSGFLALLHSCRLKLGWLVVRVDRYRRGV